ncbi:ferredoxin [Pseudoxanthomonas spadix BD-a59]|uniref:Ferredoxin n=2 Tax=Pseudomonadota TaxID=1224 RepID=G7UUT2_PSEUP|nr:2Fe-2S iron-sulfur cluster-binding protein [Pseudoxanthomonas spadix]ACO92630.1 DpaAc [Burkholderia sp. JS667]AER57555.1 ferredoxin [Pseudoxanthomonas spadix BD-a59]
MIAVTFLSEDGTSQVRSAALGTTLMRIAVQSGVQGILAECGGACACATCHVIVDASWVAAAGPANDLENEMLDYAVNRQPGSRLACQIELTESMNGLIVRIPKTQK